MGPPVSPAPQSWDVCNFRHRCGASGRALVRLMAVCGASGRLPRSAAMLLALLHSRALDGLAAPEVTVEVHLANGLPSFTLVGLADLEQPSQG